MFRVLSVRLAAATLAALAVGAAGGLAVAGVVGVSIPELGIDVPAPADKAGALERLVSVATTDSSTEPAPAPPADAAQPIPGQMLGSDTPVPIAPSLLRARNGWLVSDGKTLVAVYAGAAGDDPSVGRVVVVRQDLVSGEQTVREVDAGSTGALAIETAPLGDAVETAAQTASIRLRSSGGRVFSLDLASGELHAG